MLRTTKHQQLSLFALATGVLTAASLIYIAVLRPDYLQQSREGTPYFTPPVTNPDGGEPIDVDELIRHYRNQN